MAGAALQQDDATLVWDKQKTLLCGGKWTLPYLNQILEELTHARDEATENITIQGENIHAMDSAGAWLLYDLQQKLTAKNLTTSLLGFNEEQQSLLQLISAESEKITQPIAPPQKPIWLEIIGKNTVIRWSQAIQYINFFGEILVNFWDMLRHPKNIPWRAFFNVIDETGFQALGIVALLCTLIGVVLSYQTAQQLKLYGANVYIVPILGVAVLQEFGPLITAIIVAGRTSSAFTAQIGTMQVNAEIDALRTMGISPIVRLVLPKFFGLMISFPLLIVWADLFGLLGGILVSNHMLKVGFYGFVTSFTHEVELSTFINGLIKAPVFAAIVASVGCFHGFKVSSTADSVGRETTKSVVQAIFMIIIADAIFSIILPWQNI